MTKMITHRHLFIKALIVVALLFQVINTVWASDHSCCPVDNPDCIMVQMSNGCTACAALVIPAKIGFSFSEPTKLITISLHSFDYLSVNNHVIWRPPIVFTLI